jgi:long-chain acyl-CoA synthetase
MRAPFDSMFRWWKEVNGDTRLNGNGHDDRPAVVEHEPPPAPVEPAWLAQLDKERIPRTLRYPTTSLGRLIDQAAERFPNNPAIIYNHETWTYRDLRARVNRLAGGLARLGVRSGDRVIVALPNCPEFVLSFFAIQKLGAIVVNAGPLMGVDDLQRVMAITTPRVVIGLDLMASKIIEATHTHPPEHVVWTSLQCYQTLINRMGYQIKLWQHRERSNGSAAAVKHTTLTKLMEHAPARPPTVEPGPQTLALLQPTSGTTGAVKLVELTHANLLANATQISAWMNVRDGQESALTVLPMFHVYGLMTGLIQPISCYAAITLMTRFDAKAVLELLVEQRPSVFPAVPAICDAISNEIEQWVPRPDLSHVRFCTTGAAPLPRQIAERFEKLTGIKSVEGYGLTESSPVTHANLTSRPRYGTIGLPMPDTLCRVVEIEDPAHEVPTGQPGELLVSGPQVMSGYYHNPEATLRALWTDEHGRVWLRTGDVARMDEDGFFQIMDRKKDMIIHSGLKVYPAKVEKVLSSHDRVGDVAVVGQSDPVHTENVVAVVVLKNIGRSLEDRGALAEELRALCRQHLAAYEVPYRIVFKDHIPRSVLGKVLKATLREELGNEPTEPTPPRPTRATPAPKPTLKEAA